MTDLKALTRPLDMSEIDVRVQSISKDGRWAICLAYKDARVDMVRLDEAFGADGWSRLHKMEDGVMFCGIEANSCVKWDTGQDNQGSGHKALASDAFKRAAFNWGIGRGLYNYPAIIVATHDKEVWKDNQGSFKASSRFRPADWAWSQELEDDGSVLVLRATDKNEIDRYYYHK